MSFYITLKNFGLIPELFLLTAILFLLIYGLLLSYNKKKKLLHNSVINLSSLSLFFCLILIVNDFVNLSEKTGFSGSVIYDNFGGFSKGLICLFSIMCLIITQNHVKEQKVNYFEYTLLILFSILGFCFLSCANDLLTAYLAIELQSIAFYVLAAFKKKSMHSADSGLKYFVLGSLSSSFFLFGSSIVYGITGCINLNDLSNLFYHITPEINFDEFLDVKEYYENNAVIDENYQNYFLLVLAKKIKFSEKKPVLTMEDIMVIDKELEFFHENETNTKKVRVYMHLFEALEAAAKKYSVRKDFSLDKLSPADYELYADYMKKKLPHIIQLFTTENRGIENYMGYSIYPEDSSCEILATLRGYEKARILNAGNFSAICLTFPYFLAAEDYQTLNYFSSNKNIVLYKSTVQFGVIFLIIGLFFKLAIAPFHFWSPDVYENSVTSSTVFFSVIPKIAIFVFFYRVIYGSFFCLFVEWRQIFEIFIILTIIVGSLGGIEQKKMKSLMSYSAISHSGYLMIAFSSGTLESMHFLLFYIVIYMISTFCIWSVFVFIKVKSKYNNKLNKDLTDLALLSKSNFALTVVLSVSAFSVAGIPPLLGFLAKIGVFLGGIKTYMYFLSVISVLCSIVATFYYTKIVKVMFFENITVGKLYYPIKTYKVVIIIILCFMQVFLFFNPSLFILLTYKIALLFFV